MAEKSSLMLNESIVAGKIVWDVDVKYMDNGDARCGNCLRVRRPLSKEAREKLKGAEYYPADFIKFVIFGKRAEFFAKYFRKGDTVLIRGPIRTAKYLKKGVEVESAEIYAQQIFFVDPADPSDYKRDLPPAEEQSRAEEYDEDLMF